MATFVQTTYSTCWENGLMNENAFIASHTHFCALLRTRYWTVGMGVRLFIAAEEDTHYSIGAGGFCLTPPLPFPLLLLPSPLPPPPLPLPLPLLPSPLLPS